MSLIYLGWKIFGYKYDESEHQITSREILEDNLREGFQTPEWALSEDDGEFTITHAGFVIVAEIHGWDIEIANEVETYLCELSCGCGSGKEVQSQHKQLLRDVWKMLPWDWNLAAWVVNDDRLMLKYSSNVKGTAEPHEVISRRRQECPIPDKIVRPRRQLLRMEPPTSYLGTRIKPR